ncbi:beta-mannosidase [Bradyrhizobium sp. 160]|uniref:beta-mannosidase n=1 Tax=Bradyrhizobium sp. 160 TaxID=2782634 RepID=UPI001FFA6015|nr:beta-mannosidase [Bradyrhizobium sp. 160]
MLVFVLLCAPAAVSAADNPSATSFVKTSGTEFTLDGMPFFVAGVNNHYLPYGSHEEVARVLDDAAAMGANVVRIILQPVVVSLDGSVATIWNWKLQGETSDLAVNGTYLLYWDTVQNRTAINDGADGIGKVDFLVTEAGKRRMKFIIAFLEFYTYTGGAQQMRPWYGSQDESGFFFKDRPTKQDYRTWLSYVVQRVNPLTGRAYRDDPAIMAWELMNVGNASPESLRLAWTPEMSAHFKSLDPNHLVSSGNANMIAKMADLMILTLDFGAWHGYPLFYKLTITQFNDTITEFCQLALRARKPVLLEEFGYARSNGDSAEAYGMWLDTLARDPNCAGWVVWRQDSGRYPVDEYEHFDIRNDASLLWNIPKAGAERAVQTPEKQPGVRKCPGAPMTAPSACRTEATNARNPTGERKRSSKMIDASVVICAYTLDRWDDLDAAIASVRLVLRDRQQYQLFGDDREMPFPDRALEPILSRQLEEFGGRFGTF